MKADHFESKYFKIIIFGSLMHLFLLFLVAFFVDRNIIFEDFLLVVLARSDSTLSPAVVVYCIGIFFGILFFRKAAAIMAALSGPVVFIFLVVLYNNFTRFEVLMAMSIIHKFELFFWSAIGIFIILVHSLVLFFTNKLNPVTPPKKSKAFH